MQTAEIISFPTPSPEQIVRHMPPHQTVYALSGGRVGKRPLEGFTLPSSISGVAIGVAAMTNRGVKGLPTIAGIVDRIAPWMRCYVVPRVLTKGDGDFYDDVHEDFLVDGVRYVGAGGLCFSSQNIILIAGRQGTADMAETAAHEAFHACWRYLSLTSRATLASAAALKMPGEYYSDPEERAARMFAAYYVAHIVEGLPVQAVDICTLTAEGILQTIASGAFADHLIQDGWVEVSEALRSRRNLTVPTPAVVVPAPPKAEGAWAFACRVFASVRS